MCECLKKFCESNALGPASGCGSAAGRGRRVQETLKAPPRPPRPDGDRERRRGRAVPPGPACRAGHVSSRRSRLGGQAAVPQGRPGRAELDRGPRLRVPLPVFVGDPARSPSIPTAPPRSARNGGKEADHDRPRDAAFFGAATDGRRFSHHHNARRLTAAARASGLSADRSDPAPSTARTATPPRSRGRCPPRRPPAPRPTPRRRTSSRSRRPPPRRSPRRPAAARPPRTSATR